MKEPAAKYLIWCKCYGLWHRRSREGRACGYTEQISEAGRFTAAEAKPYIGRNWRAGYTGNRRGYADAMKLAPEFRRCPTPKQAVEAKGSAANNGVAAWRGSVIRRTEHAVLDHEQ